MFTVSSLLCDTKPVKDSFCEGVLHDFVDPERFHLSRMVAKPNEKLVILTYTSNTFSVTWYLSHSQRRPSRKTILIKEFSSRKTRQVSPMSFKPFLYRRLVREMQMMSAPLYPATDEELALQGWLSLMDLVDTLWSQEDKWTDSVPMTQD